MDLYALPPRAREHYVATLGALQAAYRLYRVREPLLFRTEDPWIEQPSRATMFDLPWVGTAYIWSDTAGVLFVVRGGVAVMYRKDGRVAGAEVFEPDWQDDPLATLLVSGSPPPMPEWN